MNNFSQLRQTHASLLLLVVLVLELCVHLHVWAVVTLSLKDLEANLYCRPEAFTTVWDPAEAQTSGQSFKSFAKKSAPAGQFARPCPSAHQDLFAEPKEHHYGGRRELAHST